MIERGELLALARDAGFPPVSVGRAVVRGESAWTRACCGGPIATPRERALLLRGLEKPLLISTVGGRARLRAWIAARRAAPTPPMSAAAHREHIAEHVQTFGDEALHGAVVSALARIPAYVCAAVLSEAAFLLVGGRLRGWCGNGPLPDSRVPIQIAGGDDVERTTLHESAHLFTGPTERHPMIPLLNRARAMAVARAERWPALEHVEQRHARNEQLAQALEQIWSER